MPPTRHSRDRGVRVQHVNEEKSGRLFSLTVQFRLVYNSNEIPRSNSMGIRTVMTNPLQSGLAQLTQWLIQANRLYKEDLSPWVKHLPTQRWLSTLSGAFIP